MHCKFRNAHVAALVLVVALCTALAAAFEITNKPPQRRTPKPGVSPMPLVNPLPLAPRPGKKEIHVRRFSAIPDFKNIGSKLVGLTPWKDDLYVSTSTSGGYIYKVTSDGVASLWFNVANRLKAETGRILDCRSGIHGGVRGIAFPPDFEKTGLFYISLMEERPKDYQNYTYFSDVANGANHDEPDSVVVEWRYNFAKKKPFWKSYRTVMRIGVPKLDHPIKQIVFQGKLLLIAHGDASTQQAVGGGGLRDDGLGKIIRINPKRRGKFPYRIPRGNPYIGNPVYKDELYAVGFRNPHNVCYSRRSGIYVTDVGRDNIEEVNIIKAGGSYGWPAREGTFVHLTKGGTGLGIGVEPLPADDAKFGYIYPNVQIGHFAPRGKKIYGQALAGSCPIENGSPLSGIFLYANFAEGGELYYSWINQMKKAVVTGPPDTLRQARVFNTSILFDHDGDVRTPPIEVRTLRDVIAADGERKPKRVDMRFGVGSQGQIYWTSKKNGAIYLITSSVPGASR